MAEDMVTTLYAPDAGEEPLLSLPDVSMLKTAPVTRLSFRGREEARKAAGKGFGFALPTKALNAKTKDDKAALWLGPDEWLLLAQDDALETTLSSLEKALSETPHALVDVSHRQDAILVTGSKATWLLNVGIAIDLHIDAFAVGTVTRTLFNKAPIMLWRVSEDSFVVEAWGSFMDYVSGIMIEAAEELKAA
ncbi:MAG: sarcosine oxidase subunit gamma [Rhodobacteraceae bacterium]|nr:sarcosine oxidase subunit gamma [Paracoccaceae bacterium]